MQGEIKSGPRWEKKASREEVGNKNRGVWVGERFWRA